MTPENKLKTRSRFGSFSGELEEVSCPICPDPPGASLIFRMSSGVGIWRCSGCAIHYASPRFTEESLLQIYENKDFADLSFYDSWSYEKWREGGDRSYNVSCLKVSLVKEFLPEGARILDVGCGTGLFCLEALKSGYQVEGIDPSDRLVDIGRKVLGVPLHQGCIENFNPGCKYAGTVVWDVLEHVYNPERILRRCYYLLEPGGYLFIQVPNHAGLSNRLKSIATVLGLKKSEFKHFGFPWHLYSFNRNSLSSLLWRVSFEPLRFESWSHLLKDAAGGPAARMIVSFYKKTCLSDYITAVALKKPQGF